MGPPDKIDKDEIDKKDLIKVIYQNTEELRQKIDMHCSLMTDLLEHTPDNIATDHNLDIKKTDMLSLNPCFPGSCSFGKSRLKEVVKEAIEVLEETKKAFKSKKLEVLRKKLTQALIE